MTAWILNQQHKSNPEARGNLTILLNSICVGCKFLSTSVRRAGVAGNDVLGKAGSENVQGEDQKKLDVVANEVFKNVLRKSGQCAVLVTEEEEEAIFFEEPHKGEYCVVFDPLDGSSNIECGVSIGTIFGVYRVRPGSQGRLEDVTRPGVDMVAAGYCMYGSMTYMMITTGDGVAGFTLDDFLGEFVLTHPNVQLPSYGSIYSINEGNAMHWDGATKAYVEEQKATGKCSLRYVGSMVADVHRTLLYGGVFMYPADKKNPSGKLRMLYECYPMAMLVEQAGGLAIDGEGKRIMEKSPASGIHDRSAIHLGSKENVERIKELLKLNR